MMLVSAIVFLDVSLGFLLAGFMSTVLVSWCALVMPLAGESQAPWRWHASGESAAAVTCAPAAEENWKAGRSVQAASSFALMTNLVSRVAIA